MIEFHDVAAPIAGEEAKAYQEVILPKVSRTFALTIPQLPLKLRPAVANAYLLLRIADTIEDEPKLSIEQKCRYEDSLIEAVTGRINAAAFAHELADQLSEGTLEAERGLVRQLPRVLQASSALRPKQFESIVGCLKLMSRGMCHFQRGASLHGLATLQDLDRYCYCVAGVVAEMLTDLFIDFEPSLTAHRRVIRGLALSFGQGLQMTNILKDQWEDRKQGVCWMPRDVFARYGTDLSTLCPGQKDAGYTLALMELIGIAHAHLRRANEYALMIPVRQSGIRRFILWTIGLSVLALRRLHSNPCFISGSQIKVSPAAVMGMIVLTRLLNSSNTGLRWLFWCATHGLPQTALSMEWSARAESSYGWPRASMPFLLDVGGYDPKDIQLF